MDEPMEDVECEREEDEEDEVVEGEEMEEEEDEERKMASRDLIPGLAAPPAFDNTIGSRTGPPPVLPKPKLPRETRFSNPDGPFRHNPIYVKDLAHFVKAKLQEGAAYFDQEYSLLPRGQLAPWEAATRRENKTKNRFRDMIPYDHSRVRLAVDEEDHDARLADYINASYVNGYEKEREYIATQGPNKYSINDMWRMIWQVKATRIVMITNLVENGKPKCNLYWPAEKESCLYGRFHVKLLSQEINPDYTIRSFQVKNTWSHETREIQQFHFTSWPDHGVPTFPTAVLAYYQKVKEYSPVSPYRANVGALPHDIDGPTIVHCSAGVGRTGTFIALDILLKQAMDKGLVDIFGVVYSLREQRINMVQTKEQYVFLHRALVDALVCRNTFIKVKAFPQVLIQLQSPAARTPMILTGAAHFNIMKPLGGKKGTNGAGAPTVMDEEFEILNQVSPVHSDIEFHDGTETINRGKNRFEGILPSDRFRPYLLTSVEEGKGNYINAVFVNGYHKKDAYIVTQMPLPNTIEDFWCLIWDHNVASVIMLNEDGANGNDPSIGIYWPREGNRQAIGGFLIEKQREEKEDEGEIIVRTFALSRLNDKQGNQPKNQKRLIRQFQLSSSVWLPTASLPSSPHPITRLLLGVNRWQAGTPTNGHPSEGPASGPIVVHCMNGQTRSGLFCAAAFIHDKLKAERGVDVFQATRSIRLAREGFIEDIEQYKFLYTIAQNLTEILPETPEESGGKSQRKQETNDNSTPRQRTFLPNSARVSQIQQKDIRGAVRQELETLI